MNKNRIPILLPIRSIVFFLFFIISSFLTGKSLNEISGWWSPVDSIINILTILLLIFVAHKDNRSFAELINYEKGKTGAKEIVVVSMIILVIGFGVMYLAGYVCYGVIPYNAPMMIAPIPKLLAIVNFILLPVTTAFAEDGLYLGYGVNRIQNKYAAILVPAFFFALQHSFIPTLFDIKYMIYRFTSFLPLTIILCGYYYKKRNPLPVMIGHAIIDIATVSWILMTSLIPGFYDNLSAMSK